MKFAIFDVARCRNERYVIDVLVDEVDFNERRSEEGISFFWRSVYIV